MSAERAEFLRSEIAWLKEQRVSVLDYPSWEVSRLDKLRRDDIAIAERELARLENSGNG